MLYAQNRLAKRSDIERAHKQGRSFFGRAIAIRAVKNNLSNTRFTVVTPLKTSKKAVERNKLKRRLREIARKDVLPNIKSGYDIIISTKAGLLDLSFGELRESVIQLFKKANLI